VFCIQYEEAEQSYRNYYLFGIIIIVSIIGYWFVFGSSNVLSEQKCIDIFSKYDSSIRDVQLNYEEGTAQYSGLDFGLSLYFSDDNSRCILTLKEPNVIKGEKNCGTDDIYFYSEEYGEYYETEVTIYDMTVIELNSKNPQSKIKFESIENVLCGD
tara:strand:+ start:134 stop:601 length:468 start_codon:yes stop_codon:yes gene_type:complete